MSVWFIHKSGGYFFIQENPLGKSLFLCFVDII